MKKVAFAEFMGFMAIECTNEAQYGTLSKHLTQQFLMNTDQYPKSITAATDILANHKPDATTSHNKNSKSIAVKNEQIVETSFVQEKSVVQEQKGQHLQCNCCGMIGHGCAICWHHDKPSRKTGGSIRSLLLINPDDLFLFRNKRASLFTRRRSMIAMMIPMTQVLLVPLLHRRVPAGVEMPKEEEVLPQLPSVQEVKRKVA